jgi:hypothetical protein
MSVSRKRGPGVNLQLVVIGALLLGLAAVLAYYGQELLRKGFGSQGERPDGQPYTAQAPVLDPQKEKLLTLIHKYQVQLGASKLIVLRDGRIYDDQTRSIIAGIDLGSELFGAGSSPAVRGPQFERLMESMPSEYLRMIPESRLGSPFVVTITEAGIRYLTK